MFETFLNPIGRKILEEKPQLTQSLVQDKQFPTNSIGSELQQLCERTGITLDTRKPVKFGISNNDETLSYVLTRYRQVHDFLHLLLNQETNFLGESTECASFIKMNNLTSAIK